MTNTQISTHDAAPDNRNDNIIIYVDGDLLHRDDAKVSVYDSGFMLGDGIWEGLRLYDGWLLLWLQLGLIFLAIHGLD